MDADWSKLFDGSRISEVDVYRLDVNAIVRDIDAGWSKLFGS